MNHNKDIEAPWTDEQVEQLNRFQRDSEFHPYTCCGDGLEQFCERKQKVSPGILIATNEGWICPCGKYKQSDCTEFMLKWKPRNF